jgi:hypothetical protein
MSAPQQNQYQSWIQAYDAVVKLDLANDLTDVVNFPINSTQEDYTRVAHSFGEIMRRAFDELNNARLSGDELQELGQAVRANESGSVRATVIATIDRLRSVRAR